MVDAWETDKMFMLKFDSLPGTDVVTYLAEKSSFSEQMVADIASQVTIIRTNHRNISRKFRELQEISRRSRKISTTRFLTYF